MNIILCVALFIIGSIVGFICVLMQRKKKNINKNIDNK